MADTRASDERRILARLRKLRGQIDAGEAKVRGLYAERESLFLEGRALVPPLVQREMGDASGVTEAAVIHVVKRANDRVVNGG